MVRNIVLYNSAKTVWLLSYSLTDSDYSNPITARPILEKGAGPDTLKRALYFTLKGLWGSCKALLRWLVWGNPGKNFDISKVMLRNCSEML